MKKIVLRIDGTFLILAGTFGFVADLLSYFSGIGPFGPKFHNDPFVISGVEAHLFGLMTGVLLWHFSRSINGDYAGNWAAVGAHLICGISNIAWFGVFVAVNGATQGVVVTIVHFLFVVLNFIVIAKRTDAVQ